VTDQPTSVRLPERLRKSLQQRAKKRRWSMTTLITQVLEAWDQAEEKKDK
jgi:predicted HicB family RNase H-like nuclease